MMKNIAYIGAGGILHITENDEDGRKTAESHCVKGHPVETDIPCGGGHALARYKGKDRAIIVYGEDNMKLHSKSRKIYNAKYKFPQLAALYAECRG